MTEKIVAAPSVLGLIMDGNGRWAQNRGLPRTAGHAQGLANMFSLADYAFRNGVKTVVCYALSTDNLRRADGESAKILELVEKYKEKFIKTFKGLGVRLKVVGELDSLPEVVRETFAEEERALSDGFDGSDGSDEKTLCLAVAYDARKEILSAVNKAVSGGSPIDEARFRELLYFSADIDLIVRTGDRKRLSDFFLFQSGYSELYFSDKMFPDFSTEDLAAAFKWYSEQNRTFGQVRR